MKSEKEIIKLRNDMQDILDSLTKAYEKNPENVPGWDVYFLQEKIGLLNWILGENDEGNNSNTN